MTAAEILFAKGACWLLAVASVLVAALTGIARWVVPGTPRQDRTPDGTPDTAPVPTGQCQWCRHRHKLLSRCGHSVEIEGGTGWVGCPCDGTAPPEEDAEADKDRSRNRTGDRTSGVDIDRASPPDRTSDRTSPARARKDRT